MKFYRHQRVSSLIRQELNNLILKNLEFLDTLVTITDVDVSAKLERAEVKISVLPGEQAAAVLKILEKNRGRLQHLLLKRINIRPMPRISFEIDRGLEAAAKVEKYLLEDDNR